MDGGDSPLTLGIFVQGTNSIQETLKNNNLIPLTTSDSSPLETNLEFSMEKAKHLIILRETELIDESTRSSGTGDASNPDNGIDNDRDTFAQLSNVEVEKEQVYDFGSVSTRDIRFRLKYGSNSNVEAFYELSNDDVSYGSEVSLGVQSTFIILDTIKTGLSFRYIRISARRVTGGGTGLSCQILQISEPKKGSIGEADIRIEIKDIENNKWRTFLDGFSNMLADSGNGIQQETITISKDITASGNTKFKEILPSIDENKILRIVLTTTSKLKHTIQLIKVF